MVVGITRRQGATDFSLRAKVARNADLTSQLSSPCHLCSVVWLSAPYLRYWLRNEWLLVSQGDKARQIFSTQCKSCTKCRSDRSIEFSSSCGVQCMVISSVSSIWLRNE